MGRFRSYPRFASALAFMSALATRAALASNAADPWASPLTQLETFITGTPTKIISIIAIVVAGIALIFGEDLGVFAKRLLMVVIATAMITGAGSIFATLFAGTNAGAFIR
jgi:type IV secretory pathway VirB2 component (pilin)